MLPNPPGSGNVPLQGAERGRMGESFQRAVQGTEQVSEASAQLKGVRRDPGPFPAGDPGENSSEVWGTVAGGYGLGLPRESGWYQSREVELRRAPSEVGEGAVLQIEDQGRLV